MTEEVAPPWTVSSEPRLSSAWRMGGGEHVYNLFYIHFSKLTDVDQKKYIEKYPEPRSWKGIYKMIINNPWIPDEDY